MKNLLSLFLAIALFSFYGCGNDDDTGLVGIWKVKYSKSANCDDPEDNIVFDLTNGDCIQDVLLEVCIDIRFDFKSNGTLVIISEFTSLNITDTDTETSNYSIEGNTISSCDDSGCESINYTISGGDELELNWTDIEDGCKYEVRAEKI